MRNKCPFILESYYKFGEVLDKEKIERLRSVDKTVFEVNDAAKKN